MKKVISFSIWGDSPFYNVGAIRNAELAKCLYPDWTCRYYIGSTTPKDIIEHLQSFDNTELIFMNIDEGWNGMFWRFDPISDPDVDIMISRDVDCRLTEREVAAVDEWLESEKILHIMRDHPMHSEPMMGGMWGCKTKELFREIVKGIYKPHEHEGIIMPENIKDVIQDWVGVERIKTERGIPESISLDVFDNHGIDQKFLRGVVYRIGAPDDAFIHDSFPHYNVWSGRMDWMRRTHKKENNTGFPTQRKNSDDFVGQIYFEDETTNKESSDYLEMKDNRIYQDDENEKGD
tara:strand:+ start:75 stop:947 length:873 start_codon:yes stop_codon:yes gene_type:complete